jgi:hypothetical protein
MARLIQIAACLIIYGTLAGCECVPRAETDKEIVPKNAANALLINALSDSEAIKFETDEIKIEEKILFDAGQFSYSKLKPGTAYLRVTSEDEKLTMMNAPIELAPDKFYTIIAYGSGFSVSAAILDDFPGEITSPQLKLCNFMENSPEVKFIISTNEAPVEQNLEFAGRSGYIELQQGNYLVKVIEKETGATIIENREIILTNGNDYTLILKGRQGVIPGPALQLAHAPKK